MEDLQLRNLKPLLKSNDKMIKVIIAFLLFLTTGLFYIQFETTREFLYVPPGIILFTIGLFLILNVFDNLKEYQGIFVALTIGLVIFMFFLDETIFGFPNPFAEVNSALLASPLADLQIYLVTIISGMTLRYLYLIFAFIALLITLDVVRKIKYHKKKYNLRKIIEIRQNSLSGMISYSFFILEIFFIPIFLLIGFFNIFQLKLGLDFTHVLIERSLSIINFPVNEGSYNGAIGVNEACSGVHSLIIFLSTFYISILILGRKTSPKRIGIALIIGTIGTLTSNWIRVVLVLLVGYLEGYKQMMWFHDYIGLVIFLVWMLVFWLGAQRYMIKGKKEIRN